MDEFRAGQRQCAQSFDSLHRVRAALQLLLQLPAAGVWSHRMMQQQLREAYSIPRDAVTFNGKDNRLTPAACSCPSCL